MEDFTVWGLIFREIRENEKFSLDSKRWETKGRHDYGQGDSRVTSGSFLVASNSVSVRL